MKRRPMKSSKIKRKRKRKEMPQRFALKPEYSPMGIRGKSLKPDALSQLVGSHQLSARYMGGWVRISEL